MPERPVSPPTNTVSAKEALEILKEGNRRFVGDVRSVETFVRQGPRSELAHMPQRPLAIVLACSDSRAPAELIFNQGLGDLFVIRVAGNITAPSIVGSVEFAAQTFGTQLVVVMGHTGCGAVGATLGAILERKGAAGPSTLSANIQDIIERIRPHVEELVLRSPSLPREELMELATRSNIRASADHLRHGSRVIESLVSEGRLEVVTAEYSLETGRVRFLEEADALSPSASPGLRRDFTAQETRMPAGREHARPGPSA